MTCEAITDNSPKPLQRLHLLMIGVVLAAGAFACARAADADTDTVTERKPWTTSRIKGSPEAPLPLSLVPVFPELKFNDPMHVRWQPDTQRYFVCELGGKVWSFPHDPAVQSADLALDLRTELKSFDPERSVGFDSLYSIVFDPEFAKNRFVYLCIILRSKTSTPLPDGSRISRFRVTEETPPRIDVASELPIITWLGGGHNGCDLAFDNSGCLLISTGDATDPSPPDRLKTGQDTSDLLSSVLRIDVRGATKEQPYRIPEDNPYRDRPGTRPEIWAYGFRNPWRIAVDPETSQLWLGDVGWEKWELIHHVQRGGNYGWSVREGNELLQPDAPVGPSPILPTRVAISHADAASITGGFVYRGKQLPSILGQYLFGDWITGRVWAVPLDETSPHHEVASGQLRIIAFSPDRDGEPLVVNHLTGTPLYQLVANDNYERELAQTRNFPRLLSQTGLFANTAEHRVAEGVRAFSVNQPQWCDGARGEHYLALPDLAQVNVYRDPRPVDAVAMFNSRLHYPEGTVLVRTLSLPKEVVASHATSNKPNETKSSAYRIETQLLHFDGRLWHGYSYLWNEAQSDAELVSAHGMELTLPMASGQRWRIHSRTECMQCHNPWPETTLAFTPEQLHRPEAGDKSDWLRLVREGYVITQDGAGKPMEPEKCVRRALAHADSESVDSRARSYLHANCAHCHQNGAGAAVDLSLKITDEPAAMKAIDVVPLKGTFGVLDAKLIAPGDAARSTLLLRMASSSIGRMPHIGSREVDLAGVALVAEWINSMKPQPVGHAESTSDANLQERAEQLVAELQKAGSVGELSPEARDQHMHSAISLAVELARSKASKVQAQGKHQALAAELVASLARSPDPLVSSLFEGHLPARDRQRRLGPSATYTDVADVIGNAAAGEAWFFDTARAQCSKCHRVGSRGGMVGPELTKIGAKLSPTQLFESLADPSRVIEPKYQSHLIVLAEGKVLSGLITDETPSEVTIVDLQGETMKLATEDIEARRPDTKSFMPAGTLTGLTAQQVADLLAYLSDLK